MRMLDEFKELRQLWSEVPASAIAAAVDISEPVRFFYEDSSREEWDFREDFHCTASPFQFAWYECAAPRWSNNEGERIAGPGTINSRLGWAVSCIPIPLEQRATAPQENPLVSLFFQQAGEAAAKIMRFDGPAPTRGDEIPAFMQSATSYWRTRAGQLLRVAVQFDYLDEQGLPIINARRTLVLNKTLNDALQTREALADEALGIAHATFMPLAFAVGFLHCKNVSLVPVEIPEKVKRKRIARGQHPGVEFKELRIEPMKRILRTEGRSGEVGLKRALHICRGHFATYTEERPLFGKIAGTFWMPAHVRGSKDAGEVRKSYKVMAPRGAA